MAELKEIAHYDASDSQKIETTEEFQPVLTYPKQRLRNISRIERVIVATIIIAFVTMAVLTIKVTTTISQSEEEISAINQDIDAQKEHAANLEQEKSELSRSEVIKKAAEDGGLTVDDENIRNVKK